MKLTLAFLLLAVTVSGDVLEKFRKRNNELIPPIYKEVMKTHTANFMFSAFSIHLGVGLLYSGAHGATASEIRTVFKLPESVEELDLEVNTTIPLLLGNDYRKFTFDYASKIYIRKCVGVRLSFRQRAENVYRSHIEHILFHDPQKAAYRMNEWVRNNTHNRIINFIDPILLDSRLFLVLIKALYFEGTWLLPFKKSDSTTGGDFWISENQTVDVPYMFRTDNYTYFECNVTRIKYIEIPVVDTNHSTFVGFVLPLERDGIEVVEANIEQVVQPHPFKIQTIYFGLPKFAFETRLQLKDIMKNLGINQVFEANEADLSGIAMWKAKLFVSFYMQKTAVRVDEEGIEAVSSDTLAVILNKPKPPPEGVKEFILDHPFIFYIKINGVIIFIGRVKDARATWKIGPAPNITDEFEKLWT